MRRNKITRSEAKSLGLERDLKKDIYFFFIEASWKKTFFILFLAYLLSNLVFAGIYTLIPNSISTENQQTFLDGFFFSIQTMSTIGYGTLSPQGFLANIIVTIESVFGLIGVAVFTGIVFSKIARPHAKILFSDNVLISTFNGERCLSFRIGNVRGNDIVQARITVSALIDEETSEGEKIRRIYDLKLKRNFTPFFNLSWTIFHVIEENSAFNESILNDGSLRAIAITITGHDGTYSNTIYARKTYYPKDIIKDKYFVDILHDTENGLKIDYENFHTFK